MLKHPSFQRKVTVCEVVSLSADSENSSWHKSFIISPSFCFFLFASGNISISLSNFPSHGGKKKFLPISTPFLYLVWTKLLYCFNNVFTKKIATFWKSDSLFQLSPGFPITTTTAELLISVQSCFLLVPLGLQLFHHVADKVTLCLGWLLEGEAGLASTRADRPHTWEIKGQTHCKLDCD